MIEAYRNVLVLFLGGLLLAGLLVMEIRRRSRSWLAARIAASIVATIALVFMIIPVHIKKERPPAGEKILVLLTKGFDKDSVSQFLSANKNSVVYAEENASKPSSGFTATTIGHVAQIKVADKNAQAIHLFGEGLLEEELKQLNAPMFVFHPGKTPGGIQSIYWNKTIKLGEKWMVQGTYFNSLSSPQKLFLNGFSTRLDSVVVPPNSRRTFHLTTIPRLTGKAVYSLMSANGRHTLVNEPLPFVVENTQPLKVLLLASSPDFENKFLKNWLAENGYKVAARTAISKNKFVREYLNLPPIAIDNINHALLVQFDVLITDARELSTFGRSVLVALENSIDKGLGLAVTADSALPASAFFSRYFKVVQLQGQAAKTTRIESADSYFTFPEISAGHPMFIRSQAGTQPLFYNQQNQPIVTATVYGQGKMLATTLVNTFEWKLGGNNDAYQQYWSAVLTAAARPVNQKESWSVDPFMPFVNKPVTVQVFNAADSIPVAQVEATHIFLKQDDDLPVYWSGTFWPVDAGWQSFVNTDGTIQSWYAFDDGDYKTIQSIQKTNATAKFQLSFSNQIQKASEPVIVKTVFPPFWFFLLFLLSAAFLWIEKKFL